MGQRQSYLSINSPQEQASNNCSQKCRSISEFMFIVLAVIGACFAIIGLLFILNIVFSILTVMVNGSTEYVITTLFGKDVYHKYFALCSTTSYNGYTGCYTTTSLYCS